MYQVLPEHLPTDVLIHEEGENIEYEEVQSEEEDDSEVVPPAVISSIMNQARNTPMVNLIENVSSDLRKTPALEKARLLPVVNAAPNTPNSHSDRIYQLNTTIAANLFEVLNERSALAIKLHRTLPFNFPGNLSLHTSKSLIMVDRFNFHFSCIWWC